jgi:hypothetical protein
MLVNAIPLLEAFSILILSASRKSILPSRMNVKSIPSIKTIFFPGFAKVVCYLRTEANNGNEQTFCALELMVHLAFESTNLLNCWLIHPPFGFD